MHKGPHFKVGPKVRDIAPRGQTENTTRDLRSCRVERVRFKVGPCTNGGGAKFHCSLLPSSLGSWDWGSRGWAALSYTHCVRVRLSAVRHTPSASGSGPPHPRSLNVEQTVERDAVAAFALSRFCNDAVCTVNLKTAPRPVCLSRL